jgi:RHS repeat-associated protein
LLSSKEFDASSGLFYFGARYYDPEIGQWLTPVMPTLKQANFKLEPAVVL